MAEAASLAPNAELLDWPRKDKRRFLHVVYRVGDLDRSIKYDALLWRKNFWISRLSGLIICFQVLYWMFWDEIVEEEGCARREIF